MLTCIVRFKYFHNTFLLNLFKTEKILTNCTVENINNSFQEMFKRIVSPLYLLVLSLIACLIIIKSKDDYTYGKYKFGLFIFGVITIIISEISIKYYTANTFQNIFLLFLPILFILFIYSYFKIKLKKPNLRNQ